MRADWDRRAREDAERHIYTRDAAGDEADFDESGRANFNQLVRPYLPVLLDGRPAKECTAVEIGCGVGRMTRWFAREFGAVDALDVSPEMIAEARRRLADFAQVRLHAGSGQDLEPVSAESADLVFSYIVFQHIPSRAAIENYVREAARVLRPGGAFKFQVNGDQSPAYRAHPPDTWLGVSFSESEVREMLAGAGFAVLSAEGAGTQYFVVTARKGLLPPPPPGPRSYILPGEPWAAGQLLEGWGEPVDRSWRPVAARSRARLAVPEGRDVRFFAGLYVWPGEPSPERRILVAIEDRLVHEERIRGPGDHCFEFEVGGGGRDVTVEMRIEPACERAPAVRCFGMYARRR